MMAATSEKAKRQIKRGEHGKLVKGTAPLDRKGHERGPDHGPRVTASLKTAMRQFLDEEGHLVPDALRRALENPYDLKAAVAASKVLLDYGLKVDGPGRAGKGLTIVLSSNQDPLAARSRPTPPIDLTLSGPVIDAEPGVGSGARATSPAPAATKALPPGPASATAAAILRTAGPEKSTRPKGTTPEYLSELVAEAERLDARSWRGTCPACQVRQTLTWGRAPDGRVADLTCERGCTRSRIVAALKVRAQQLRAVEAAANVRTIKMGGEDMVQMHEPRYQFEDPDPPPRGNPWKDTWP